MLFTCFARVSAITGALFYPVSIPPFLVYRWDSIVLESRVLSARAWPVLSPVHFALRVAELVHRRWRRPWQAMPSFLRLHQATRQVIDRSIERSSESFIAAWRCYSASASTSVSRQLTSR